MVEPGLHAQMASAAQVAFHHPNHVRTDNDDAHRHHHARPRLPVIPDLRFEYSYLRSIQPFIEVQRVSSSPQETKQSRSTEIELIDKALLDQGYEALDTSLGMDEKDAGSVQGQAAVVQAPREVITVQWGKVFWATMRDQVISPLVQGALWALASHFLTPYSIGIGSRMGAFVHSHMPTKEGLGVVWLRSWVRNLRVGSNTTVQASRASR
ncbi:unnamed protein product [Cyclocybe aegerita]|uniref:Uncharacterized protein n=1 Tax=Cyclocybe aegerita TaxID=1973307 RepID=A0A8S0WP85_CYCAE|nr:unnamed protein product [Cyclocybe aegerita]